MLIPETGLKRLKDRNDKMKIEPRVTSAIVIMSIFRKHTITFPITLTLIRVHIIRLDFSNPNDTAF